MGGEADPHLASVVWLEQVKRGVFERRTVETGMPHHATLDVADYNADAKPDIVVGWFAVAGPPPGVADLWLSNSVAK
jgi:hypothetical protein